MKKGGWIAKIKKKLLAAFEQTWLLFWCFTLDKLLPLNVLEIF